MAITLSPRLRSVLFWILLIAFAGISLWWIFAVPYREGEVLRAIPVEATFVSWHRAPIERLDRLLSHPWVRMAIRENGGDWASLQTLLDSKEGRIWKERLARREMAVAYVPALRFSGMPAWIFSFWVGGFSQRLRWMLETQEKSAFRAAAPEPGRMIWVFSNMQGLPPGWHLSVAVREGVVLAALSPDPLAARTALLTAEGISAVPNIRAAGWLEEALRKLRTPPLPDRGWWRDDREGTLWCFDIAWEEDETWTIELCADRPAPPPVAADWAPLTRLSQEAEGSMHLSWPWLYPTVRSWDGDLALGIDRLVMGVSGRREVPLWIGVFGGERGGRIRSLFGSGLSERIQGLKVPLLVLALPAVDEHRARETAAAVLDLLNQKWPYGLVPRPAGVSSGRELTAIEGTLGGFYRDLAPSEEVVYTVAEGWFFLASHIGAFENLIPLVAQGGGSGGVESRAAGLSARGQELSRSLGRFLSALSLSYALGGSPSAERMRHQIRQWRRWLAWLEGAERIELVWRPSGAGSRMTIRLRPASSTPAILEDRNP